MFVYEEGDRIVIEPIPSLDELHGIHASDSERGEVLEKTRELKEAERQNEAERAERLRPDGADDEDGDDEDGDE